LGLFLLIGVFVACKTFEAFFLPKKIQKCSQKITLIDKKILAELAAGKG